MAAKHTRLELTWIGKDDRPRLEPRILLEDPELSYHAEKRVSDNDIYDNMLIYGDNLLALKALQYNYLGQVKCVYIDPPYNTGTAFEHYDDGLEHSLWLSLMRERLVLLWDLLHPSEGSLWVSIDDREAAYLRILLDEICGRQSFVASIVWQKRYSRENREAIGDSHEYILVYARNPECFKRARNTLPLEERQRRLYKNPDNDPRGPWQSVSLTAQGFRSNQMYSITALNGRVHLPPEGSCWKVVEERYKAELADNRIYFGRDGNGVPRRKNFLSEAAGIVPWTWWPHEEVGHTDEAKRESQLLFGSGNSFGTPKPERLVERIISIATKPGDLVLDSFLGSGTTTAVAHKLGRRWIGVELGEHCKTHCHPRMRKVISGSDPRGITDSAGWKGGGGFRYFVLATSLLEQDKWGNWVVSKQYNPEMLAEAMCKLEGFRYAPDPDVFWIHGQSTETDLIYVTTQNLSQEQLRFLSDQVGDERTLLICCSAFRAKPDDFANLTLKKIPQAVLHRCEWGRDDYSLNVNALPDPEPEPDQNIEESSESMASAEETSEAVTPRPATRRGRPRRRSSTMQELPLFANLDQGGDA
jgi:adenine-specific DNA-methyltransferase